MAELTPEEILEGDFDIDIPNFEKWNPPPKGGRYTYVNFDVHLFDDPKFRRLSAAGRLIWIWFCLRRARGCTHLSHIRATDLPEPSQTRANRCTAEVVKMAKLGLICLRQSALTDRQTDRLTPNTKSEPAASQKNPQIKKPKPPSLRSEIEFLYLTHYPRKEGKSKGVKLLDRTVSRERLPELETAMKNYAAKVHREGTEPKFVKHFSTWASEWEDWLNPATGGFTSKPKYQPIDFDNIVD